jgi:thiol-disulfide isomerase/thioredoxin
MKHSQILISLIFFFSFFQNIQAQQIPERFQAKMEQFIQDDLYVKVSSILFDVDEVPEAQVYINFSKEVKAELEAILKQEISTMSAEEQQLAKAFVAEMTVQLGELYLERISEYEREEKLQYYLGFLQETGLNQSIHYLTEGLGRALMMGLHGAMEIPYGAPSPEIGNYIDTMEPALQELMRAAEMMNEMGSLVMPYAEIENRLQRFFAGFPKSRFSDGLKSTFQGLEKFKAGAKINDFEFLDLEGKKVMLTDYRDKIIYLDLWASWCGPCINTFRTKTPEFEQKLRAYEDVVLMYVSIDENQDPWKNYLSKNEMRGVHLFAGKGFESEIMKYFKVWGIPRYIIIDKDNKIFTVNAPRPGDEPYEVLVSLATK